MYLYRTTFFWGILDDRNTWVAANFKTILQGKKKETNIPIVAWDFLKYGLEITSTWFLFKTFYN